MLPSHRNDRDHRTDLDGAPKSQTISLLEIDSSFTPTGGWSVSSTLPPTPGQGFIINGTYYKWAGAKKGQPVGHLQVVCTVTSPVDASTFSGWLHCDATAFLPAGQIVVSGSRNFSAKFSDLPIVGGTGAYVGAQGFVRRRNIGPQDSSNSSDIFRITN